MSWISLSEKYKDIIEQISTYVFANYKFLYLYSPEELKAKQILEAVAQNTEVSHIYTYDIIRGLQCEQDKKLKYRGKDDTTDIYKALDYITENIEHRSFVIFKDLHSLFENDPRLQRAFKNCIIDLLINEIPVYLFNISPILYIPSELEKEVVLIDIPLPQRDVIKEIVEKFLIESNFHGIGEVLKSRLVEALNGLTEQEIQNILQFCVQDGELNEDDIQIIVDHKKQIIRKGGVLEFVKPEDKIENIGGLVELKNWIKNKKIIFDELDKASKYGVDIPKGILLFGMPGCGKSLTAKVIASYFEMPLLRLDMGMIMGPYVGQSEENMRKAIKMAEATSPSVLWIDELEKAFAGIMDGGSSSREISARIFATILTWMQEKTKPVFVVATANNISGMPPEFLRKGRFDEIFFVDFPKEDEIKQIFEIHLRKRGKTEWLKDININEIINTLKQRLFSGADIEALIKEVVEISFVQKKEKISTEDFLNQIKNFKPISETMKEEINKIRDLAKKYGFKSAN